jgi:arylsulfatase
MLRRTAFTIALVCCALLVAGWLFVRVSTRQAQMELAESPIHLFIADDWLDGDVVDCGISHTAEWGEGSLHRPLLPCRLGNRRAAPHQGKQWRTGRKNQLTVHFAHRAHRQLVMKCKAQPFPKRQRVQRMVVKVNDHKLGAFEVPVAWDDLSVRVPKRFQRRGPNTITLSFSYVAPLGSGKQARWSEPVSAFFREISLVRESSTRASRRKSSWFGSDLVYNSDSGRFVMTRPGRLVTQIAFPADASHLGLEIRVPPTLDRRLSKVVLTIENVDRDPIRTIRLPIADRRFEDHDGVLKGAIAVHEFAGQSSLLTFAVDPHPEGTSIEIEPPVPIPTPLEPATERTSHANPQPETARPDIVLITLDAARPDHFSCYGYARPTTPHIDRLADESLLFSNAVALAPYTVGSVPTMITGLSFVDHQVVSKDFVLSDSAVTLAEYLREVGYRTACFSGTPNNSRERGLGQGYADFYEGWRYRVPQNLRDPHQISRQVLKWLDSQDESQPIHLQLHYVPPHAPYQPAPGFDVFTDPDYEGPANGKTRTTKAINAGALTPSEADIQHTVDLYDGNLLAADDAVGMVLDALRTRSRWNDTVVLITADHGEAFYEHKTIGHNRPLYDEMLRVPFILRAPARFDREGIDTGRLASLADIVPTLLATAGLKPVEAVDGINLIAEEDRGQTPSGRYLILRDADDTPLYGLRSLRWKLMLSPSGRGLLFDLHADPRELNDLSLERPAVFVGLSQLIAQRIRRPPAVDKSDEEVVTTSTDRQMLRALGYVE